MHLDTPHIKARLIATLGEKPTAFIQAVRFVHLLRTKYHTDPEASLLPVFLHAGDTAIDVGANGADWTYWIKRCTGRSGAVFAFEADPYYALATGYAIRLLRLKRTRLFPYGLSDADEEVPLRILDSHGMRTFGISHIERDADRRGEDVRMVHLRTLDSLIGEYPQLLTAALIKCDVEGYELYVFRGASEILERSRPFVILEIGHGEAEGYSQAELFGFFRDRHYASFALVGDRTLAPTDETMGQEKALSINRVLLPEEKVARVREQVRILA